ncbi:MAG: Crp/Fnr family transcriptional regulator [Clostridia bacterium]|nr:Crp/Fnr family transcriptional regulator [Clostridia bacterium]
MKKYFDILKNCILFDGIERDNLENMLGCINGRIEEYSKGEAVMQEGIAVKDIGIVLSGAVQIERTDYYGNRSIITTAEPGEIFAESFACAETKELPFCITAAVKSEIMLIDCKRVIHTCSRSCEFHSSMIYNLMKIIATKNILLNQRTEITSKRTTRDKLMTYLLITAKKNDSDSFSIPYDRQTLADFLGVDRSGLSAEISKLRNEGIIESRKNRFRLL